MNRQRAPTAVEFQELLTGYVVGAEVEEVAGFEIVEVAGCDNGLVSDWPGRLCHSS